MQGIKQESKSYCSTIMKLDISGRQKQNSHWKVQEYKKEHNPKLFTGKAWEGKVKVNIKMIVDDWKFVSSKPTSAKNNNNGERENKIWTKRKTKFRKKKWGKKKNKNI